jgi:hypothetical protein
MKAKAVTPNSLTVQSTESPKKENYNFIRKTFEFRSGVQRFFRSSGSEEILSGIKPSCSNQSEV